MHHKPLFSAVILLPILAGLSTRTDAQAPATQPQSVATLINQGEDAFNAGKMDEARQAFESAFQAAPKNLTAARDLGITYLRLDKSALAAHPLEIASGAKKLDRSLVLALAYQFIATKSPMQGAKRVLNYLDENSAAPDEPMLNALGIALSQAEIAGVKSSFYLDSKKTYKKLNAKLEATRPGEKRWGIDWMPAADVDAKQAAVTDAQATIATNTTAARKLTSQIADLQAKKDAVLYTEGDNNQTQKKAAYQKQIDELDKQLSQAKKELETAQKTLNDTLPKWPEQIPAESITLESDGHVHAPPPAPSPAQ